MIREKLVEKGVGDPLKFRWRSHEVSRIEALSDAVFAFAVTLLVVALEVPKTYDELMEVMRGFGAFAICFALLFIVWFNQYKFFRRYGLNDTLTIIINAVLLFVVLFYVYPLKFLFTLLIDKFTGGHGEVRLPNGTVEGMVENAHQVANLMIIFGLGYVAVFAVFALLYWRAYRKRVELELTKLESFDTRTDIRESLLNVSIGLVSLAIAIIGGGKYAGFAGMIYMVTPVVMTVHGKWDGSRRKKLEKLVRAEA